MSTGFAIKRDSSGLNSFAPPFSDQGFKVILASGVAQSFTIPSNYKEWIVLFSIETGGSIWVSLNGTPTVATGTISATTDERNPGARLVKAGDVISMITSATSLEVGITIYAILE